MLLRLLWFQCLFGVPEHAGLPQAAALLACTQAIHALAQKADAKHSFAKLRSEAVLTFNQAWSQPGGRPCSEDLPKLLMADLTGSKVAAQPADSDGLLKVLWDWTEACWGSVAASRSGTVVCL